MPHRMFLLALLAFHSLSAHALIITGRYTAYESRSVWMGTDSPGDGHVINGEFFVDTSRFGDSTDYWNVDPNAIGLSLTRFEGGYPVTQNIGSQTLLLGNGPGMSDSLIATSYYPKGYGAELHLFGNLFDADMSAADTVSFDPLRSFYYHGYIRDVSFAGTYYTLTALSVDVSNGVPEPAPLALAGLALALGGGLRWRAHRRG